MSENVKILVVDDEEHTRLGYAEILKLEGYNVTTADNGFEAFKTASKESFDVIITDLRMPEMDGHQFLEKLRKFDENVKVIIITAFGSFKSYKHSQDMKVLQYLNKPVKASELLGAIEAAISG